MKANVIYEAIRLSPMSFVYCLIFLNGAIDQAWEGKPAFVAKLLMAAAFAFNVYWFYTQKESERKKLAGTSEELGRL